MKKQVWIFSLGGNEVSPGGSKDPATGKSITPDIAHQWQRTLETCRVIASFIEKRPGDSYVLTHGNGPVDVRSGPPRKKTLLATMSLPWSAA